MSVYYDMNRGWFSKEKEFQAVKELSASIRRGQTLGIVGESGSGKTTLAMALLRLKSSRGEIYLGDTAIQGLTAKQMRPMRRVIQVVFQDPYGSLSPRLSVLEIIAAGLKVHHPELSGGERRDKVAQALVEVGLEPTVMDRYPHEFSGGQRQRIAIARAIIVDPEVIVLDEPTSALDLSVQARIVDLLRDLQVRKNLAYLFISHDLKVVRALAHDVIVMKDGEIVEQSSAKEVLDAPQQDYTKALMAAAFELEAS
jgi:microcin C transport system ATP-binding protein